MNKLKRLFGPRALAAEGLHDPCDLVASLRHVVRLIRPAHRPGVKVPEGWLAWPFFWKALRS
ncbi:MAG TPA: hypothetical protein VJA21_27345 [Verrucomicrobiae bacterium]